MTKSQHKYVPRGSVTVCTVDGCNRVHYCKRFCRRHYEQWRRWGDPRAMGSPGAPAQEDVTYQGAHSRIWRTRGQARKYACVDCGDPAHEWSLRWDAVNVRVGPFPDTRQGFGRYSTDPYEYEPRCRPCHRRYDQNAVQEASAS